MKSLLSFSSVVIKMGFKGYSFLCITILECSEYFAAVVDYAALLSEIVFDLDSFLTFLKLLTFIFLRFFQE